MAEQVKLFEIDIDTTDVTKSLVETKKAIDALTASQKANKKETDAELKAYVETEADLKNLQREYRVQSKLLQDLNAVQIENVQTVEDARRALSAVSTQWAQVTKVEGENSEASKKLGNQKLMLTERLKKLEAATGDSRRNVGNYTGGIIEAAKAMGQFGGEAGGLPNILGSVTQGFQAGKGGATGFIGGLKGIGGAITATGIGLFVQILALLVNVFSKLKSVTDPIEQAFSGLAFVFTEITTRVEKLVGALGFLLKGDFKKAADEAAGAVDNLGNSLANAAKSGAALKAEQQDLEDNASRLLVINAENQKRIDELIAQSKDRSKSEKERIALIKEANALEQKNFNLNKQQADEELANLQKQLASKTKLTTAELDLFFSEKSTAAQREKIQKKIDKDEELFNQYRDKRVEAAKEQGASLALQEKLQGRLNVLEEQREQNAEKAAAARQKAAEKNAAAQQKAIEEEKKRKEQIIKNLEEEVRLYEAANKQIVITEENLTTELVAEAVQRFSELQKLRLKVFEEQRRQGVITEGQFQNLLNTLDADFNAFVSGISQKGLDAVLKKFVDDVKKAQLEVSKNQDTGLLTEESLNRQKALIEQLRIARVAEAQATIKNATDLEIALFQINKEAKDANKALDDQFTNEANAREAINTANRLELLKLNGETELQLKRDQLELQRLAEIEEAEKTGTDVTLINQKYQALNTKLEQEAQKAKLAIAANYLTQFSQLVGENTAFGKIAASAAAVINTYLAVTQALTQGQTLAQKIAGVAFALTTGLAAVVKINSTKTPSAPKSSAKFEQGGTAVTGGKRHAQGGTKYYGEDGHTVELERGERWFVLNRNATSQLENLEKFNALFPAGRRLGTFQSGGFPQMAAQSNSQALIASADIASSIRNVPIVVDVKDIISETNRRVEVVDSATL